VSVLGIGAIALAAYLLGASPRLDERFLGRAARVTLEVGYLAVLGVIVGGSNACVVAIWLSLRTRLEQLIADKEFFDGIKPAADRLLRCRWDHVVVTTGRLNSVTAAAQVHRSGSSRSSSSPTHARTS